MLNNTGIIELLSLIALYLLNYLIRRLPKIPILARRNLTGQAVIPQSSRGSIQSKDWQRLVLAGKLILANTPLLHLFFLIFSISIFPLASNPNSGCCFLRKGNSQL